MTSIPDIDAIADALASGATHSYWDYDSVPMREIQPDDSTLRAADAAALAAVPSAFAAHLVGMQDTWG